MKYSFTTAILENLKMYTTFIMVISVKVNVKYKAQTCSPKKLITPNAISENRDFFRIAKKYELIISWWLFK